MACAGAAAAELTGPVGIDGSSTVDPITEAVGASTTVPFPLEVKPHQCSKVALVLDDQHASGSYHVTVGRSASPACDGAMVSGDTSSPGAHVDCDVQSTWVPPELDWRRSLGK